MQTQNQLQNYEEQQQQVGIPSAIDSADLKTILNYVHTDISDFSTYAALPRIVSAYTPSTGATLSAGTTTADESIIVNAAGLIAALTVNLPADASSRIGQQVGIVSKNAITVLTVAASSQTINGAAVSLFSAGGSIVYEKTAAATWTRIL